MIKSKIFFGVIRSFIFLPLFLYILMIASVTLSQASDQDFSNSEVNIQNNYEILNARPKTLQKKWSPQSKRGDCFIYL